MSEEKNEMWITGFWRRIGALVIDIIILGILGWSLGFFLESTLVEIGAWGRLIGFIIALIYFGILNSSITNGQTLGKKILNIKVVDANNKTISIFRSFGRYAILGTPFFLNGAQFSDDVLLSPWGYLLSFIIFGGLLSVIYLYIFNRNTRQSLHDVIVGTYVININAEQKSLKPIWKPHYVVSILFFVTAGIVPVFTLDLATQQPFSQMLTTREALMNHDDVKYVTINDGKNITTTVKTGTTETTYVSAQVFLNKNKIKDENLAKDLANSVLNTYSSAKEKNVIVIFLIYGYDIGIASSWNQFSYRYDPSQL